MAAATISRHIYETTRFKNQMETEITTEQIEDRTECFNDRFPCRKEGSVLYTAFKNWAKKIFNLYLYM